MNTSKEETGNKQKIEYGVVINLVNETKNV